MPSMTSCWPSRPTWSGCSPKPANSWRSFRSGGPSWCRHGSRRGWPSVDWPTWPAHGIGRRARRQWRAEQLSPALADARLDQAGTALAEAKQQAARLPRLDAELAQLDRQAAELTERSQAASRAEAGLAERLAGLAATIERDELA